MLNALVVGGRSRSDPQCALLPCSCRITACKPKDYCRECRLDSPCLSGSAHSHVPGPAGLPQLGESIVSSSPLHTSAPRLASCFSHLLSLIISPFFGVWGFDHHRLLCCLIVITRCWWSHPKKPSVCYRCCVYFTKGQAKVWNPQVFLSQKQRVRLIQCQLWNSDMKSVVCHRIHKRETWLFSSPFFNIMPKAIVCAGQKGKDNVSFQLSSVFCDEHVFLISEFKINLVIFEI